MNFSEQFNPMIFKSDVKNWFIINTFYQNTNFLITYVPYIFLQCKLESLTVLQKKYLKFNSLTTAETPKYTKSSQHYLSNIVVVI